MSKDELKIELLEKAMSEIYDAVDELSMLSGDIWYLMQEQKQWAETYNNICEWIDRKKELINEYERIKDTPVLIDHSGNKMLYNEVEEMRSFDLRKLGAYPKECVLVAIGSGKELRFSFPSKILRDEKKRNIERIIKSEKHVINKSDK